MPKSTFVVVSRDTAELALRALEDAQTEIESFEKQEDWYTASQKMMDRIEKAINNLKGLL